MSDTTEELKDTSILPADPDEEDVPKEGDLSKEDPFFLRRKKPNPIWNNTYIRVSFTTFITFVACLLFYYVLFHHANLAEGYRWISNILRPVLWGLCIAYLLTPIVNGIEYRILRPCFKNRIGNGKWARGCSIFITVLLTFSILGLLLYLFLSQVIPSLQNLIANLDVYTANMNTWLQRILDDHPDELSNYFTNATVNITEDITDYLNENIFDKPSEFLKTVTTSLLSMVLVVWNFLIGFIIAIYVMAGKEKMVARAKKMTYSFFSRHTANRMVEAFHYMHNTFIGFFFGKIVDSLIIGMICFIGTSLMQTPYRALVSVIVGITNVIPFFGPYIGAIPSAILIFMVDPMHPLNVLYFLIFILILQQFDGNFLGPKILGNYTGLAGFWIIFAITLFGGVFGIFGMVVGVPLFAVIYNGLKEMTNSGLKRRGYPTDGEKYTYLAKVKSDGEFITFVPEFMKKREKNNRKKKGSEQNENTDPSEMK